MTVSVESRTRLSRNFPRRMPAMTPAATPMTISKAKAIPAMRRVSGHASAIISLMGREPLRLVPKSPWTRPARS
ncbi:hypothetical protein SMICM304S_10686 [Streptomyces microflavus]